jgi:protein-tyrosine kinase
VRSKVNRFSPKFSAQSQSGNADDVSGQLVNLTDPSNPAAEAFRVLRTNFLHMQVDTPPKLILITSPGPNEGKSTICVNLGVTLAQAEKSTLIVDCDLRRPRLHSFFSARNVRGLTDVLAGEGRMGEIWQEPMPGLKLITAGLPPPNPAELLGSQRFAEFLDRVRQEFDYVLLDIAPVNVVSDSLIIATQVDGVLLVLDAQNTRKGTVPQTVRSLEAVGANLLGTVMNNVRIRQSRHYRRYIGDYTY